MGTSGEVPHVPAGGGRSMDLAWGLGVGLQAAAEGGAPRRGAAGLGGPGTEEPADDQGEPHGRDRPDSEHGGLPGDGGGGTRDYKPRANPVPAGPVGGSAVFAPPRAARAVTTARRGLTA